jgi:ADP-ribose pyrophosphatase
MPKESNYPRPNAIITKPDNAKLVFEGKIFDVYQWEQELYDGSKKTFESLKRMDSVNVIAVTKDKKIVITKQSQPGKQEFLGLLGGQMDAGEVPEEAAARELLEESGMKADSFELFNSENLGGKIDWAIFTFIAHGCEKVADQELDAGEKIELIELSLEEFLTEVTKESFRDTEVGNKFLRIKQDPKLMEETIKRILGL